MRRLYELLGTLALVVAMSTWLLFLAFCVGLFCGMPTAANQFEAAFRWGLGVFGVLYVVSLAISFAL